LIIRDEAKALHLLENISYYRLSGYWYPMLATPKDNHCFKPHSHFNTAFKIYCFDRELRKLVLGELEKIFLLSMIVCLLNIINPGHTFKTKLTRLLTKYKMIDVKAMGFPDDWSEGDFWQ